MSYRESTPEERIADSVDALAATVQTTSKAINERLDKLITILQTRAQAQIDDRRYQEPKDE